MLDSFNTIAIRGNVLCVAMARQISVSNEVYELLLERKGKKSFSEVIKESLCPKHEKIDIMSLAGILKEDKEKLEKLKQQIAAEREANYGRSFQ
jgi:predicted CopG family antitoxin